MILFTLLSTLAMSQALILGEYTVAILSKDNLICNGAVIHDALILTSACCVNKTNASELSIRAGSKNYKHGGVTTEVERIFTHKKYNQPPHDYDIAILKLKGCIAVNAPNIAEIPVSKHISAKEGLLIGWVPDDNLGILQIRKVPVLSPAEFSQKTTENITERMLCAEISRDQRCIQFPSGTPLVVNEKLVGIKSFGNQCNLNIFTNVSVLQ